MLDLDFSDQDSQTPPRFEGFVFDLDEEIYRKAEGISQSNLKTLITEPFKYFNKVESSPTKDMVEGTLLHLLLCEPQNLEKKFFIIDDLKMAKRPIIQEEIGNRIAYSRGDFNRIEDCVGYIKRKMLERFGCDLDDLYGEVSYFGEYRGYRVKGRADKLTKNLKGALDFKKSKSADPSEFLKTAINLNYGIQDYFYREIMQLQDFKFVAIETEPIKVNGNDVFLFSVFESSELMLEQAGIDVDYAFTALECREKLSEPAYIGESIADAIENGVDVVHTLTPPLWRMKERRQIRI